jgi:hypothetical protein
MKYLAVFLITIFSTSLLFSAPTKQDIETFLEEINTPFSLGISGGNFNSSFYTGGILHFNLEAGVTGLGFDMKNPEGKGDINCSISMFHVKGTAGIFSGFTPVSSWQGFLGLEAGTGFFISPQFGQLNEYRGTFPYGFSLLSKLNLLKNRGFIPALSFTFEYSYLVDTDFKFGGGFSEEKSTCSLNQSSFYYHIDIRENIGLFNLYSGYGWILPTLKGKYETEYREGDITISPPNIGKYYFGITVPVYLVDVNLELGRSGPYGFYGAAFGFRI